MQLEVRKEFIKVNHALQMTDKKKKEHVRLVYRLEDARITF